MTDVTVPRIKKIRDVYHCPPDKSISVRAVILCSFAHGRSVVKNISRCDDVLSAAGCMRNLGASIEFDGDTAYITGSPFRSAKLDCGNSATTARLLTGLLAGLDGIFEIDGDESLRNRPMSRVIDPLSIMGANIESTDGRLPIKIIGSALGGLEYFTPVPSAQIKSALCLAALNGSAPVKIIEKVKTRDHTERMLKGMNGQIKTIGNTVVCAPSVLFGRDITVPGDISAAVYMMCLALATRRECMIRGVGLNETRSHIITLLRRCGADISIDNVTESDEPYGDIRVRGGVLPFEIGGEDIPLLIDELPALAALACFANGTSVISGAEELRYKESDRIKNTVSALRALGADIEETGDGMVIRGGKQLLFGTVDPKGDHRIAMAAAVAGAAGQGVLGLTSRSQM